MTTPRTVVGTGGAVRGRHRWRSVTVILAVTAVALAGCVPIDRPSTASARTSPPPTPSAAPPAGLSATLVQYRRDQPRRFVEVQLDNSGGTAIDVTLVAVTLPGFTPPDEVRRTTHLEPQRRVDLPVALGAVSCDETPRGAAAAIVEVVSDDAAVRTTLPVDDAGLLDRLRSFECAVERADAAIAIGLSPMWRPRGTGRDLTVVGTATLSARDGAAPVDVTGIDGGILFVARADAVVPALPVQLDARRPSVTLEFTLIPARCDAHAIGEARRLTTVTFWVSVGGAQPVPLRRAPDEAGYRTLVSALRTRCGIS